MFIRFNFKFWSMIWHMGSANLAIFALIVINSWAISYLEKLPEEVKLRVGTTVSVLVMTGTRGSESKKVAVAAPRALQ